MFSGSECGLEALSFLFGADQRAGRSICHNAPKDSATRLTVLATNVQDVCSSVSFAGVLQAMRDNDNALVSQEIRPDEVFRGDRWATVFALRGWEQSDWIPAP